ncbi:MAG TPA: hypothetical protein VM913_07570 [Sphingomicrobium sp.]|jgi:hypothetical protein|nr:hypothetical protein [Sphingomicrobium sp.]
MKRSFVLLLAPLLTSISITAAGFAKSPDSDYLSVDKLIELKALSVTTDEVRALRNRGTTSFSADELVRLRLAGMLP